MIERMLATGLSIALMVGGIGCRADVDEPGGGGGQAVQAYEGDLAFIDGLVPHQQVAVGLADEALAKARRPELRAFAAKLKVAEGHEIAALRRQRAAWVGEDEVPPLDAEPPIRLAAGRDFDRRWVQRMLRHEQAAIDMAERALTESERPETRALAERVISKRQARRGELQRLLARLD